jgi:peptidoglycan biosynthesis protein MviN/MurJ (putative lipid II flippase)
MPLPVLANPSPFYSERPRAGLIFRSSFRIFSLSALTIGLGLAVQIGLAATLGTGREMDAFLVSATLPTFLNTMAMFTAVSAPVPFLKEELQSSGRLGRSKAFSRIFAASRKSRFCPLVFRTPPG